MLRIPAIMEDIWQYSPVKGSPRLLLLAIAKHADDDGNGAYPSLATLQRLTQLSHSQVCLILRQLATDGHLRIEHGAGPKGSNAYTILRTWEASPSPKIRHAKIGRAKTAHAIARPKIGPNQGSKEKEKISSRISDVRSSDVRSSDQTPPPSPHQLDPKAAHWARTTLDQASLLYQLATGTAPQGDQPSTIDTPPPPPKKSREPALYFQGKLCPGGHDDGTGHTLRRVSNGNCTECDVERTRAKRQAQAAAKAKMPKPARRVIDLATHRQAQGG